MHYDFYRTDKQQFYRTDKHINDYILYIFHEIIRLMIKDTNVVVENLNFRRHGFSNYSIYRIAFSFLTDIHYR